MVILYILNLVMNKIIISLVKLKILQELFFACILTYPQKRMRKKEKEMKPVELEFKFCLDTCTVSSGQVIELSCVSLLMCKKGYNNCFSHSFHKE